LRVVPNKYPALDSRPFAGVAVEPHHEIPGRGFHEVVIDTPDHDRPLSSFSLGQLGDSLSVYRSRLETLGKRQEVKSFALFRNDGREAGASQEHPHAQVLALPLVPPRLQHEIDVANRFLLERGCCLTCGMAESDGRDGRRVVASDGHFLAVTSFAARFPYETWVVPTRHSHDFRDCSPDEIRSLAAMLKRLLGALESAVGRVPYNLILQTAPVEMSAAAARAFHWRLELLPRLSAPSGFELGSGVFIVSVTPEDAASRLRSAIEAGSA
jgi:UDPglucose--hexose-1-phosphate uridylyltransferase